MANEKRLIDANAFKMFLEVVRQHYLEGDTFSSDFAALVIETVQDEYLANAPTVDAVEVVRCAKCKRCMMCYPEKQIDKEATPGWYCKEFKGWRRPDDFCSYGERRTDGN